MCCIFAFGTNVFAESSKEILGQQLEEVASKAAAWTYLECYPERKTLCRETDCAEAKPSIMLKLDRAQGTVSRCDSAGCDSYAALFETAGIVTNIQSKTARGVLVRIFGDARYLEIASMALDSHISVGSCSSTAGD